MITYEELCESLERHRRRQANQAELDQLDSGAAPAAQRRKDITGETFSLRPQPGEDGFTQPAEDTHEIDVDEMAVVDDR